MNGGGGFFDGDFFNLKLEEPIANDKEFAFCLEPCVDEGLAFGSDAGGDTEDDENSSFLLLTMEDGEGRG